MAQLLEAPRLLNPFGGVSSDVVRFLTDVRNPLARDQLAQLLAHELYLVDQADKYSGPFKERAHHINSKKHILYWAHKNDLLGPELRTFHEAGVIESTDRLYFFLAKHKINYYQALLTEYPNRQFLSQDGRFLDYSEDIRGTSPEETWRWMLMNTINNLRFFRLDGKTAVFYGAYPDERCHACAVGEHCHTSLVPAADNGVPYDPLDATYVETYLFQAQLTPDPETHTVVRPRIIRMETLPDGKVVPTLLIATMRDYRTNVWKLGNA